MSLRVFHIVFIVASILMSIFVGVWGVRSYWADRELMHLMLGIGFFVGGAVLIRYSFWFVARVKALPL